MNAMPDRAKSLFYGNHIEDYNHSVSQAISYLTNYNPAVQRHINPNDIASSCSSCLKLIAIHIMVRDVKSQHILNDMQQSHIYDKADKLFNILNVPSNEIADAFRWYDNWRGPDIERLRSEYHACLRRCYFISYIQVRPVWDEFMRDPVLAYNQFQQYLGSDEFLVHVS